MSSKALSTVVLLVAALAVSGVARAQEEAAQGYRVGPGDVLRVTVWGFDELSQTLVVSEQGAISFPLIGVVDCAGLTVLELETRLRDTLADGYLKNPQVTVVVEEYHSQKVNVLGEVLKPGTYTLQGRTTVLEMLSIAGGVTPKAGERAILLRPHAQEGSEPSTETILVNLGELFAGTTVENVTVESGDTVFVPESDYFFVMGEVNRPGGFKMEQDMTVLQAITLAGGFTAKASTKKIKVVRIIDGKKLERKVSPNDLIQPQDTIIVPESFF